MPNSSNPAPQRHRKGRRWRPLAAIAVALCGLGITLAVNPLAHADDILPEAAEVTVPATGTNCEAAFVVKNYGGVNGLEGLIDPGHCDTPGHTLLSSNADSDFEVVTIPQDPFQNAYLPNATELVSANFFRAGADNKSSWTNADRNGAVNPTVIGTASVGARVCRFGGVSGYRCGTVTSVNGAPRGTGFANDTYGYLRLDFPCVPGDSGAAVLSADYSQALGIISGRRLSDGACFASQLARIGPKVSGLELYQPPAAGQRYYYEVFSDGTWHRADRQLSKDDCGALLGRAANSIQANGLSARCARA